MFTNLTTVSQGTVGLGIAIGYFCTKNYIVSVPLNDNQAYDLIVDMGSGPKTIQIKTTRRRNNSRSQDYVVALKRMHHNKTQNIMRSFDNTTVDYVFVVTEQNTKYFIPSSEIEHSSDITLNRNYDKYILEG